MTTDAGSKTYTVLVRGLFEDAVGHDEFGDDDSFFHIGGDSLAGLAITRGLGDALGCRIAMRLLFDHPTVRGLAGQADLLAAGAAATGRQ